MTEPTPLDPPATSPPTPTSGAASGAMGERVLVLAPSKRFPRRLVIQCRLREVYVFLYGPTPPDLGPILAYASASIEDCRFSVRDGHGDLWLNRASFDMSPEEMARVREFLKPHPVREDRV